MVLRGVLMQITGANFASPSPQVMKRGRGEEIIDRITGAGEAIDAVNSTGDTAFYGSKSLRNFVKLSQKLRKIRLFSGFALIPDLVNVGYYANRSYHSKTSQGRIDNALHTISSVSSYLYHQSAFAMGLRDVKWVKPHSVSWAGTMMLVSIPLQIATFAVNVRGWRHTNRLVKELKLNRSFEKIETDELRKISEQILDHQDELLEEHFQIDDVEEFKTCLSDMKTDAPEVVRKKGRALQKRLFSKKLSSALQALAVVVSLTATLIFLFSPLASIGYGVFALGSLMEVAAWVHKYYVHRKFCKEMGIKAKDIFVVGALKCIYKKVRDIFSCSFPQSTETQASLADSKKLLSSPLTA